ncbi:glutathione S-transferase family protein [uncultured Tateyamaria sp.]|uniref:glutathione S-transferase family protein n=1 Tax=uncultured Tateyamaria sp. TaxID=455651 RepID=UPI0026164157|nr:glutathione S-transferase family protein [uncultured Tateyamaria sp.]
MLELYYSKGSSAVAAHVLLEEVGATYEPIEVSIAKGEHRMPAFLRRNPKGRIPALGTAEGVISESPAILEYIAQSYPDAGVQPRGPFKQAQARSLCAYLCATAHVAFAHKHRGARWAVAEASLRDMQGRVAQNLSDCAAYLQKEAVASGPWAMGEQFTYCDPYLFQFSRWMEVAEVEIADFPKLQMHRDAMLARPATRKVLAMHGLI